MLGYALWCLILYICTTSIRFYLKYASFIIISFFLSFCKICLKQWTYKYVQPILLILTQFSYKNDIFPIHSARVCSSTVMVILIINTILSWQAANSVMRAMQHLTERDTSSQEMYLSHRAASTLRGGASIADYIWIRKIADLNYQLRFIIAIRHHLSPKNRLR